MRIVAGRWRGRAIEVPTGPLVRPTADRVREAWLSRVQYDVPDAAVLDLYAGSGALGLEALSRGARVAHFVESHPVSLRALDANLRTLGAGPAAVVHRANVERFVASLAAEAYDVAFADPPYHAGNARLLAEAWLALPFARVLGIEHESGEVMPAGDTRRYGTTAITLYRLPDV